jgi:LemA protein
MGSAFLSGITLLLWMVVISSIIMLIIVIICYNMIISNKNAVVRAWADVITYERQKNNVLGDLEQAIKGYQAYEGDLQVKITLLRTALKEIKLDELNNKILKEVEEQTRALIKGINLALENYPNLKAVTLVQKFMKELAKQQENIAAAITIFNKNVEEFNNSIELFPGHLVNNFLNKLVTIEPFVDQQALAAFEYKLNW